jgi:hypothetical protein
MEKIAQNLPQKLILQRALTYAIIAAWSLYQSAATGPAFQVAVAFGGTVYLMGSKRDMQYKWLCAPSPTPIPMAEIL